MFCRNSHPARHYPWACEKDLFQGMQSSSLLLLLVKHPLISTLSHVSIQGLYPLSPWARTVVECYFSVCASDRDATFHCFCYGDSLLMFVSFLLIHQLIRNITIFIFIMMVMIFNKLNVWVTVHRDPLESLTTDASERTLQSYLRTFSHLKVQTRVRPKLHVFVTLLPFVWSVCPVVVIIYMGCIYVLYTQY